jgi:hypothetical protein
MEHLTKQQIVLLTLFTSFVTSIATGIVTVALMDQAPVGVTSTINHVIEHTIEEVAMSPSSTTSQSASVANGASAGNTFANPADQIAAATALAEKSLVRIELNGATTGLGVIVSSKGIVVSDKSAVAVLGSYTAILPDGNQYPVQILQSQNNGDIVLLFIQTPTAKKEIFNPATFVSLSGSGAPILGEAVLALSGTDSTTVNTGIIKKITTDASSTVSSFVTNIDPSQTALGTPLFDTYGHLIGIKTLSLEAQDQSSGAPDMYYPAALLSAVVSSI